MKMKKAFFVLCLLLIMIPVLNAIANETTAVFGEIQVFEVMNGTKTKAIGERALVAADKDLMTDDDLINFYKTHIKDSGYNWFTIDFGDGTGYTFAGSYNLFTYLYQHEDGWAQSDPEMEIGIGFVFDDSVDLKIALKVPVLSTIEEYQDWANQNNVDLVLLNESYQGVKSGSEIVEIWEKIVYQGDMLTIIVK